MRTRRETGSPVKLSRLLYSKGQAAEGRSSVSMSDFQMVRDTTETDWAATKVVKTYGLVGEVVEKEDGENVQ